MKNFDKRFKSSLPVLSTTSAFHPMLTPLAKSSQSPALHNHRVAADHFFDNCEAEEFKTEWKKLKYDLLSWNEHMTYPY